MTSKRIKKKKKTSKFVALLLRCLKIERKNYIQKQTISKTHDEFFLRGLPLQKKRERNKQTRRDDSCHFTSLSRAKKKFRFHMTWKRKHNKQQAKKKKKKNDKTTTDD